MSGVSSIKMTLRSVSSHAGSLLYIALKCSNNDGSMKLFLIPIHHITQMRPIYDDPIKAINPISSELGAMNNQDYNIWKPFQFIHTRLELECNLLKISSKNDAIFSNTEIKKELCTFPGKMMNSISHTSLTKKNEVLKANEIESLLKKILYQFRLIDFQIIGNYKKHRTNDFQFLFKKLIYFSNFNPLILCNNEISYIKFGYLFSILRHSNEKLFRKIILYFNEDKKVIKKIDIENLLIVNNFSIFNKTFTFQGRKYVSK